MTTIYSYPAIFRKDIEGGTDALTVTFPDIPGCISCGENLEDAYVQAEEALYVMLCWKRENAIAFPHPTPQSEISPKEYESVHVIKTDLGLKKDFKSILMENEAQAIVIPDFDNKNLPKGTLEAIEKFTKVNFTEETDG